jgi:hypothetical protein
MNQSLTDKIYYELEIIRILSRLSVFAVENESVDAKNYSLKYIFEDIEKRCWVVSEYLEKQADKL